MTLVKTKIKIVHLIYSFILLQQFLNKFNGLSVSDQVIKVVNEVVTQLHLQHGQPQRKMQDKL